MFSCHIKNSSAKLALALASSFQCLQNRCREGKAVRSPCCRSSVLLQREHAWIVQGRAIQMPRENTGSIEAAAAVYSNAFRADILWDGRTFVFLHYGAWLPSLIFDSCVVSRVSYAEWWMLYTWVGRILLYISTFVMCLFPFTNMLLSAMQYSLDNAVAAFWTQNVSRTGEWGTVPPATQTCREVMQHFSLNCRGIFFNLAGPQMYPSCCISTWVAV